MCGARYIEIFAMVIEPSALASLTANAKSLRTLPLWARRATSSYLPFGRFLGSSNLSDIEISPGSQSDGFSFDKKLAAVLHYALGNS